MVETRSRRYLWVSLLIVVAAFTGSRVFLRFFFQPLATDLRGYFEYAVNGVDRGLVPYKDNPTDRPLEYPPLAYSAMALPRWLATPIPEADFIQGYHWDAEPDYWETFRWQMFGFDVAAFTLFLLIVHRRRPEFLLEAGLGYVLVTTVLGHVLYDRFDIGVLFFLLLWAYAWLRSEAGERGAVYWQAAAYGALGLGISYKLVPIVVAPLALAADCRTIRRLRNVGRQAIMLAILGVTALGPFAYYYWKAGDAVLGIFRYHRARGIEIESIYASLMLALRPLGLEVKVTQGYGSSNLESDISGVLLTASSVLLVVVLGGAMLWTCLARSRPDRATTYRVACWTLAASLVVAKVISVQYLVWALPVLLLLGADSLTRRQYIEFAALLGIVAGLTTMVFPYLWSDTPYGDPSYINPHPLVPDLDWIPCTALGVRNVMLLSLVLWTLYPRCAAIRFHRPLNF